MPTLAPDTSSSLQCVSSCVYCVCVRDTGCCTPALSLAHVRAYARGGFSVLLNQALLYRDCRPIANSKLSRFGARSDRPSNRSWRYRSIGYVSYGFLHVIGSSEAHRQMDRNPDIQRNYHTRVALYVCADTQREGRINGNRRFAKAASLLSCNALDKKAITNP